MKRLLTALVLAAAMVLSLMACGSDEPSRQATDRERAEKPAEQSERQEQKDKAEPVFIATEFAFEGPDTLPAGATKLVMENVGEQEHEMVVIRLAEGKTFEDVQRVLEKNPNAKPPKWVTIVGGTGAKPGKTATFEADLQAGSHILLCFVTDKESKQPHVALGMVKELTVE